MGPQAYLLQAFEELYEKPLTPLVEEILRWVDETWGAGGAGGETGGQGDYVPAQDSAHLLLCYVLTVIMVQMT